MYIKATTDMTKYFSSVIQVNMTETDITRMATDYADNELELFRKTVGLFTAKTIYSATA